MKLLKLHIHNIASIVDATIEFDKPPLSDSDVYLITGNTGAGKTTILDSICLALFNNTPRMAKGKDTSVKNDNDVLTLKDPRRLMRRNTGEAFVELVFENNGVEYKAEWQVQRGKNKKPNVNINPVTRVLTNTKTNEVLTSVGTKDKELQAKIQEIIGLDFDQFCRTTMLAQNEFTKFLASDENERAEILEKITKTNVFSAVGSKVYEITSQKEREWDEAKKAASQTGLTNEEIIQKKEEIAKLEEESNVKIAERNDAQKKRNWIEKEIELSDIENKAKEAFEEASGQLNSDDYNNSLKFVKDWNATTEARQRLRKQHEAEIAENQLKQKLLGQREAFRKVMGGFDSAKQKLEDLRKKLSDANIYLDSKRDKASTFDNVQTIVAYLGTIIAKTQVISQFKYNIQTREKQLEETLIPKQKEAAQNLKLAEDNLKAVNDDIEKKNGELEKLKLGELRKERDEIKELIFNIKQAVEDLKDIDAKKKARAEESARIEELGIAIEAKVKKLNEELLPAYKEALKNKDAAELSRDMLRNSVDSFAKQMRTHLTVGCECPVCRQKVERLPLEEELDKMYSAAEERYKKAKAEFDNADEAKNKAEADINSEKQRLENDKVKLAADSSVENAGEKAAQACKLCGITDLTENTLADLETLLSSKSSYLAKELEPKIADGEAIEKKLRELQVSSNQLSEVLKEKESANNTATKNVEDCKAQIKSYNDSITEYNKEIKDAADGLEPLVTVASWQYDWRTQTVMFKDDLQAASKEYSLRKNSKDEIEKKLGLWQEGVNNVSSIIDKIIEACAEWKDVEPLPEQGQTGLIAQATDVLQNVGAITGSLNDARKTMAEMSELLTEFSLSSGISVERLEELNKITSIEMLSGKLESMRQAKEQKKALWEQAVEKHQQHQEQKPELADTDTIEVVKMAYQNADEEMTGLSKRIGGIQKELSDDANLKNGLEALINKEQQARVEYEKWERLNRMIGDKEGKKFRMVAQSYIFDGLLHSANAYLQRLEPRYTLKSVDGTLFSSLEDAYQGYSSRDTGSLSGGESFLVSLALALALSDIGQGLSVDTLFIDEGFGSLSGQPLSNAINTLRSLRGKNGRHVGIISHIQEVRDNIPVQIQVEKGASGSSSTVFIRP